MFFGPWSARASSLKVVTTLFPLYDFARQVGGDGAEITTLLPAGAEPHSWEPKPSDIVTVSRADVFLYVGERMEPWAHDVLRAVGKRDITALEILERRDLFREGERSPPSGRGHPGSGLEGDPHIWLDLDLAARVVEIVGQVFAGKDPDREGPYLERAREYAERLRQLDQRYLTGLAACRTRRLVTGGHMAFGYLARRYGLDQMPLYGLNPDSEPSPRRMAEMVAMMRREGVATVFFEELVNPRLAQVLAEETGARTILLNPGANLSAGQFAAGVSFIEIMETNLKNLREGLSCE